MTNFFKKLGEILSMDIRQAIFKKEQPADVPVLTQAVEPTEVTAAAAPYKVEAPAAETAGTPVEVPVKKARKTAKKSTKRPRKSAEV